MLFILLNPYFAFILLNPYFAFYPWRFLLCLLSLEILTLLFIVGNSYFAFYRWKFLLSFFSLEILTLLFVLLNQYTLLFILGHSYLCFFDHCCIFVFWPQMEVPPLGLYPELLQYYTMILQHPRIIVGDAGFEPGTSASATSPLLTALFSHNQFVIRFLRFWALTLAFLVTDLLFIYFVYYYYYWKYSGSLPIALSLWGRYLSWYLVCKLYYFRLNNYFLVFVCNLYVLYVVPLL